MTQESLRQEEDPALETFERERPRLFGIAYRMLGSVHEAEDVLQDAYIRWRGVDPAGVRHPPAFLVRLVTRLCIDTLRSARRRRMEYVGPWLPEPIVESAREDLSHDPAGLHDLADDLSTAFLLVLERLTPVERAVFLLHESFGYSYREVGEVVGKTEENCRQIHRRARLRLAQGGRARPVDPAEHEALLYRFMQAAREGDLDSLLRMLSEDAVAYSDGGGRVSAARNPVKGASNVARFTLGLSKKAAPDVEFRFERVNGALGLVTYRAGRVTTVVTVHVEEGRIHRIFLVLNPEKLPGGE